MGTPIHDLSVEETYTAAPGQAVFTLPCRLFPGHEDDFVVEVNDVAFAYNIAPGAGQFSTAATGAEGLNVTLGAACAGGESVHIYRNLPCERITQLPEAGPVSMADVNDQLAYLTALIQDGKLTRKQIEAMVAETLADLTAAVASKQPASANLTALSGLVLTAHAGLVIKVNGTSDGFVLSVDLQGGGGGGGALGDGDYGDIVVSGLGSVLTVDNGVITLAKMANMATGSLIYRKTAGAGAPEVNTLATLKTDLGLSGTNTGDQFTAMTSSRLLGRYSGGFGAAQEISLGSGLVFDTGSLRVDYANAAAIRAGTADKFIAANDLMASAAFITLADGATIAWDMATGFNAKVTLGGARALGTPTNPKEGITYSLMVIQDGTGSRTLTYPAAVSFGSAGAPVLSTAGGKEDLITLLCTDAVTPKFKASFFKSA